MPSGWAGWPVQAKASEASTAMGTDGFASQSRAGSSLGRQGLAEAREDARECLQRLTPASCPSWPPAEPTPSARPSAMVSGLRAPRLSHGKGRREARLDPRVAPGRSQGSFDPAPPVQVHPVTRSVLRRPPSETTPLRLPMSHWIWPYGTGHNRPHPYQVRPCG